MKLEKIAVNKRPETPQGVEIELVVPTEPLEESLLGHLLVSYLRDLKSSNRIPYDLPAQFQAQHTSQGTFVVRGFVESSGFYEPPQPICIVGLRHVNGRFDLVHAPVPDRSAQPQPSAVATPEAE